MSIRGKGQLPRRSFGGPTDESALDVNDNLSSNEAASPRTLGGAGRVSFGTMNHRPSFLARWRRGGQDEESAGATPRSPMPERPPIPSMIQPANEPESTPLPKLSMIVFCIVRFVSRRVLPAMSYLRSDRRPCSANSSARTSVLHSYYSWWKVRLQILIILSMCSWCVGFGETEDEAEIAFNTGVLGERAYGLVPSRLLIVRHSLCLLPHPILDFTTLGMLRSLTCPMHIDRLPGYHRSEARHKDRPYDFPAGKRSYCRYLRHFYISEAGSLRPPAAGYLRRCRRCRSWKRCLHHGSQQ